MDQQAKDQNALQKSLHRSGSQPQTLLRRLGSRASAKNASLQQTTPAWRNPDSLLLLALMPVALTGAWNTGAQISNALAIEANTSLAGWQQGFFLRFSNLDTGTLSHLWLGLSYLLPLVFASFITCLIWDRIFAQWQKRPPDGENLSLALIFVLLLPATLPLGFIVLGISFGCFFGKHIFSGSRRYLVSPALLGVLFLHYSYPDSLTASIPFYPSTDPLFHRLGSNWRTAAIKRSLV